MSRKYLLGCSASGAKCADDVHGSARKSRATLGLHKLLHRLSLKVEV